MTTRRMFFVLLIERRIRKRYPEYCVKSVRETGVFLVDESLGYGDANTIVHTKRINRLVYMPNKRAVGMRDNGIIFLISFDETPCVGKK